MKHDITRDIVTCPVCHTAYCPNDGEICLCPEEPVVSEWEDPPFQPDKKPVEDWQDFSLQQLDTEASTEH